MLESSPAPQPERSPWHNSEECVIEIRDLEDYIRNSSSGGSPCHPGTEWKQREGNSLCGAVGSLATMPFRYLSRSRSTPQVKGASTDGCSITTTEEAICAFTPGLPDTSTDFLRSENSSDSHDANSNITLPQDPHDDLDGSFSALSMTQSPTFGQVPNFTQQKAMQRSWVGAFKDVVTGRRSDGPNPEASAKSTRYVPLAFKKAQGDRQIKCHKLLHTCTEPTVCYDNDTASKFNKDSCIFIEDLFKSTLCTQCENGVQR